MRDSYREPLFILSSAFLAAIVACSSEGPQTLPSSAAGTSAAPTAPGMATSPAATATAGTASASTPATSPNSSGSPIATPSAGTSAGASGAPRPSAAGASGSPQPSAAGKLDSERIAIGGHSMGSVSTFGNLKDARIKTSIHMAGGLIGNPEGVDESWLKDLHAPAAFLCGSADNGLTRARNDFNAADPKVPVFFGVLAGVGHTDEFSATNGGRWGRIVIAWLRWQLAGDSSFARSFTGADCEFCKGDWTAMKHAID